MQKAKDMEMRTLNKRHAFGIKSDVYGCLHWLDEHTLTYPVGRNVVIHNTSSNAQKFFLTSEKTESITAIALSPNKKYIAIAESGDHPQIQIVDTNTRKRRRVLNVTDSQSRSIVAIEFSADGRHLVTQGSGYNGQLLYWNWERSKPLAHVGINEGGQGDPKRDGAPGGKAAMDGAMDGKGKEAAYVTKVSINPKDPLHIVVSGNGLFRSYRYADGRLQISPGGPPKPQTFNFTTHAWVTDERIIAATDNADLLYIEDGEYRGQLTSAPSDGHAIMTIEPTSRGFVCGGESGLIHIFEAADDKDVYRKVKTISLESRDLPEDISKRSVIRAFALTHGEDTLALATSTRQIYGLKFGHEWSRAEAPTFTSIAQPFHADAIVSLDTCVRKPLVATASKDRTVRIWNIQEHTVEVIQQFAAEPNAVALHPSGLHVLVCFQDKVLFMNLYGDQMHSFKQLSIRGVGLVKFSVGGQYFAAVYSNTIQIYNTYTCELMGSMRATSSKVEALQWASSSPYPLDTRLVACTKDGMVMDWDVKTMHKQADHKADKLGYNAVAADERNVYVVGTREVAQDGTVGAAGGKEGKKLQTKLREIESANMHGANDTAATDYEFPDLQITKLCLANHHRLLFGGCADGSIKLMTFPLQGGIHDPPILAHADEVKGIAVSYDENLFFSVGADGSFYIFDIKEDGRTAKRETTYADEILISRQDLDEKAAVAAGLNHMVQELIHDMEYNEKRRGTQHDERVKEQTNAFQEDVEKQAQQFAQVWNEKLDLEKVHAEKKRDTSSRYDDECEHKEEQFNQTLQGLEEKSRSKRSLMEAQKVDFEIRRKEFEADTERDETELIRAHTELMDEKKSLIEKLQGQAKRDSETHEEMRTQLETDTDTEIEQVKRKYENALFKERENFLHMRGENAIAKKAFVAYQKDIENREAELRALDASKERLNATSRDLKARINALSSEIEDKDQTIAEKEKKIYELKKKNQELEKHKFVLDHRIRQLKSEIEPRQMQIAREKEKIQAKDRELEQFHKNNLTLRSTIFELREKIEGQQGDIKKLLNRLKDFDTYRGRVKTDIGELAQLVQDPQQLALGIEKVFHDHVVARGGKRTAPLAGELKSEFNTHTEYLARTVESLKRKVTEDHSAHRGEVSSVMKDNLGLIKEINDLRREIVRLKQQQPGDAPAGATAGGPASAAATGGGAMPSPGSTFAGGGASTLGGTQSVHQDPAAAQAMQKEIESNRGDIQKLRTKIEELEKSIQIRTQPRPGSRDRQLPPLTS